MSSPIVIVGAGVAGLVSAALLAHQGERVIVLEKSDRVGGKLRQINGVDSGPTVLTLRWVLDSVFEACGERLDSYLELEPLQNLARHFWRPGAYGLDNEGWFDLYADPRQADDEVARFFGGNQARLYREFCHTASALYQTLEEPYIRSEKPTFLGLSRRLGVSGLTQLAQLGPFASLWKSLDRFFPDPRLKQLFGRYATYCGASPWHAPATLMLIAQVEMAGVWSPIGGMQAIAFALEELARARGCEFIMNANWERFETEGERLKSVHFIKDNRSESISAKAAIFNGDIATLGDRLAQKPSRRSLSALTWSIKTSTPAEGVPLVRHNLFFDDAYDQEFQDIFQKQRLPQRGTVYLCAQDRHDDAQSRHSQERMLLLVNAPACADTHPENLSSAEILQCQKRHFERLNKHGLHWTQSDSQIVATSPKDFAHLFPGSGGALYGQASHGWFTQFQRRGSKSPIQGVYLAGGSVHPGPGLPMVMRSGQLAVEALMADQISRFRLHPVVTSGGTSTQSAATSALL